MPKKENIQQMFDGIAPSYDRLNHLMSMNVDRLWRKRALKEIVDGTPQRILDVACGTGDSTIAIAKAAGSGSRVVGVDISEGMMAPLMEKPPTKACTTAFACKWPMPRPFRSRMPLSTG